MASAPRSSRQILLVDDDKSSLAIMAQLSTARGFHVLAAASLKAARALVCPENDIGFVISDLQLPDGNACDLMRELSTQFGLKGVAITGFGMDADLARTREAGFILHLTKPIQVSDLERALELAKRHMGPSA